MPTLCYPVESIERLLNLFVSLVSIGKTVVVVVVVVVGYTQTLHVFPVIFVQSRVGVELIRRWLDMDQEQASDL